MHPGCGSCPLQQHVPGRGTHGCQQQEQPWEAPLRALQGQQEPRTCPHSLCSQPGPGMPQSAHLRVPGNALMNRLAAPIRDACFGDDVTAGPGDSLPPILPHLPGKQVSRNPALSSGSSDSGDGERAEGSSADGAAPLCAPAPPKHPRGPNCGRAVASPQPPALLTRLSQSRGFPKPPGGLTLQLTPVQGMLHG